LTDRPEIDRTLRRIFADLFDKEPESFAAESSPDSLPEWDSLSHVTLIGALEEAFEISIPFEDQIDMLTFELVADVVAERLRTGA
jgi:acyl carrier protein